MSIFNAILDFLFPAKCFLCKTEGMPLCLSCLHSFPKAERPTENWIYPLFDFRHQGVKKAIWLLKYGKKKELANILGSILYEKVIEEIEELETFQNFTNPIWIPIPLSKERSKERGFNQAEIILKSILRKASEKPEYFHNLLIKNKNTPNQARIKDKTARLQNMHGVFKITQAQKIKGRNIILIDDVVTTGATLKEARRVLKESGAKKIVAFTLAH